MNNYNMQQRSATLHTLNTAPQVPSPSGGRRAPQVPSPSGGRLGWGWGRAWGCGRTCATTLAATLTLLIAGNVHAATATLTPTADAYVQAGTNASKNYGTLTSLRMRTSTTTASNYDSYLKFDTSSVVGSISNVKLRLYAKLSATGSVSTSAYAVADTVWGETSITWNNKPARGALLGSVAVTSTAYAYKEIDVTAYVQSEVAAGRKVLSFAYHNGANTSIYITANSKEATNKPQLLITYSTNAAPTVSISSPANNASFTAPAGITLTANAADSDGSISKVDYYNGATLIGTATTAPYTYTWLNVAAGTYSLTAKATDNAGAVTTSSPIGITVKTNVAPTVSLTSPANGAITIAPANIPLTANAADSDGTIAKVEYYSGTTLIATGATTAPYGANWFNVAPGVYNITARATDNSGATTSSAPVGITVNANQAPTVTLGSPVNGSVVSAPANITLSANASDLDGGVSKIEYYAGSTLIGTSNGPEPYSVAWNNVGAGVYSLSAKATDNLGAITSSAPVTLTVNSLPSVSIVTPSTGQNFVAPATVNLSANASDADGSISKVEYYNGATLVASGSAAPDFAATWNAPQGSHSLTAKAIDDKGGSTTSGAVGILVNPNLPPNVDLISPVANQNFAAPADINLSATANDGDGSIASVEFYNGSTLIGTATALPYTYTWSSVPAGSYSITAKAIDDKGAATTSPAANISVATVAVASGVYYIYADHLNTPRAITDTANNVVWKWDSDPFGTSVAQEGTTANGARFSYNLRFPGQYYDQETGLNYNWHRYYSPETGNYIQSDPIGLNGGSYSTYAYVSGNPISLIDLDGLLGRGIPNNPNGGAIAKQTPSPLTTLARQISLCLCAISPKYCVPTNAINAGTPGFLGIYPQVLGIDPAAQTSVFGNVTVSTTVFGNVPANPYPTNFGSLGALDLAQTVAHESLHVTQEGPFRRMGRENPAIDDEAEMFVTANRQRILDCLKNRCSVK